MLRCASIKSRFWKKILEKYLENHRCWFVFKKVGQFDSPVSSYCEDKWTLQMKKKWRQNWKKDRRNLEQLFCLSFLRKWLFSDRCVEKKKGKVNWRKKKKLTFLFSFPTIVIFQSLLGERETGIPPDTNSFISLTFFVIFSNEMIWIC